jgi:hypothetical protein
VTELSATISEIEEALDAGTYRTGPWQGLLRDANASSPEGLAPLAEAISRVSDKLHRRDGRRTLPFPIAMVFEVVGTVVGFGVLLIGLRDTSVAWVALATGILVTTLQPLLKVGVGTLLGVRYSYAYLWGIEPRFKMRYGTYLSAARWRRILLHLSGTIGSALALLWVSCLSRGTMPITSDILGALFWVLMAFQTVLFVAVLAGVRTVPFVGLLRLTSAGGAALEAQIAVRER